MDESWEDDAPVVAGIAKDDGGTAFSKGRGSFKSNDWEDNDNEQEYGDNSYKSGGRGGRDGNRGGRGGYRGGRSGGGRDNGWSKNGDDNEEGGWGDRGHRGGRGGGRGGGRSHDQDNGWGNNGDSQENGEGFQGRRGGRGGRGGGRGGRGGRDGDRAGGDSWGNGGDSNEWGNSNDNDGSHGGRSGGRGGGRDGPKEDGEVEKPREIYEPKEIEDPNELFEAGNTTGINFAKYDSIEVKINGENCPAPIKSFEESGLKQIICNNVKKSGYGMPTPIQKYAIPIVMNGRDLMGCAQTGSGKTAAFLLPIINRLLENKDDLSMSSGGHSVEPLAVIVSPTRELAIQIYEQTKKFALDSILKIAISYGGTSVNYQTRQLMNGCHILVATPGRMLDFVNKGKISFGNIRFVVLDEADRMLDMGFLPNIEEMMNHETMTKIGDRQTLMFSATFPEDIQRLAGKFLHDYIFVAVGIVGSACSDVEQVFYEIDRFQKRDKLVEILKADADRTLVFVETKRNADFLATYLSENDVKTTSIHGDRLQSQRELALKDFTRGSHKVLVATSVAARGLDIKNVKHVINFDLPKSIDEYVHRIGRTGRVGNRGKATSFYNSAEDSAIAGSLATILKRAGQPVPDFLSSSHGDYESADFGGSDIRQNNFGQSSQADMEEEAW